MTAVREPLGRLAVPLAASSPPARRSPPGRRAGRLRATLTSESLVIWAVASLLLFALGYWTTVGLHVVFADGESRLAHAYMAVWDHPAKLATIGFVWPPLQTLSLLPFVLIKPLATSLTALPLFSALCGGLLLAVLNRTMAIMGVDRGWRFPLLVAFAANPLFLCYGSNGMAEILYLLLLSGGLHYLVSWHLGGARSYRKLAMSGLCMGFGFLARYELAAWIAVMTVWIVAVTWPRRRRWADVEAPVLIFLAPSVYLVAAWSIISMQVIGGGPLAWFTRANDQPQGPAIVHPHVISIAGDVLTLTARVSPLLWIVPAGLLTVALVRRDRFAAWLAVLVLLGAGVTFLLVADRPHTGLLQPRYNIRSLPAMLIGAGWLLRSIPPGTVRRLTGALLLAALLAAVPLAFVMEEHYPYQYAEAAWAEAIKSVVGGENTRLVDVATARSRDDAQLARWINAHIRRAKSILIDDAAFPDVVLRSGRADEFVARTDHGDGYWTGVLLNPWGRVRYIVASNPSSARAAGFGDAVEAFSPTAYRGGFPGTRVIERTATAAVLRVADQAPLSVLLARAVSVAVTRGAGQAQRQLELKASLR